MDVLRDLSYPVMLDMPVLSLSVSSVIKVVQPAPLIRDNKVRVRLISRRLVELKGWAAHR